MQNKNQNNTPATSNQPLELTAKQLFQACDESLIPFDNTTDLKEPHMYVGQERAIEALDFGVGIEHEGFNLFVLGSTGLGKNTIVRKLLEDKHNGERTLYDWCYINNFKQPHKPHVLQLPVGLGVQLKLDMEQLIEDLLIAMPALFQSDEYRRRAQEINDEYKRREEQAIEELNEKARKEHIMVIRSPGGFSLAPTKDDKIIAPDEFDKLPEDERDHITKTIEELRLGLEDALNRIPSWQKEIRERFKQLNREITQTAINQLFIDLEEKYKDLQAVQTYLTDVKQNVINSAEEFRIRGSEEYSDGNQLARTKGLTRFEVNVLVDNSETNGVPIVYENNPSLQNLLGRVEHTAQMGTLVTDFTLIKGGAFHRANGGYLILDARKVLTSPYAWDALKRVLSSREIRIESLSQILSLASTTSLEPEPVKLDIKLILTGERLLYYLLQHYDPEFDLLFKVAADFSEDMQRTHENTALYSHLIAGLQQQHQILPISRSGVARIIEHCSRLVGDAEKVSLHIGNLLDLIREAEYWAKKNQHEQINRDDVQQAIDKQYYRLDQLRERVFESILRGIHLIDTTGKKIGQVNGLSVLQIGDHAFGRPSRITATARLGSGKVIDIEREVELGGAIHSKGVLILSSYLANRYAQDEPLSLSASLVFEQSYGMIEGDSASVAELCALLSVLADSPINQGLAITGSVNQYGEVQAIGGVNEKIEGHFDICAAREFNGSQGVIIPSSNIKHLMLKQAVIDAVEQQQFHIYAVNHVDEVMSLLTGMSAGDADDKGDYPDDSINGKIQLRIRELQKLRKAFSEDKSKDKS